jgi:hypothetical protein
MSWLEWAAPRLAGWQDGLPYAHSCNEWAQSISSLLGGDEPIKASFSLTAERYCPKTS